MVRQRKRFVFLLLAMLVAALGFAAPGAFAQTAQGRISGQVTDSTGATVPNATINIENIATHVGRTLQTNSTGDYSAPSIDPGVYSMTVEAPGFTKVVRERVQIEVGNDLKIDFHLKIGSINETVEVKDEAPLTEASNAVLSGVLSNKAINELPLQGRDFQNLLPLHPGVQRDPGGGFHTLTSNGNRPDDNNFIIDGATDNDAYYGETVMNDAGISGTPASTLPLDAMQEFNTTEQPGAEFGAKPGVVVNIGIKSGTDDIHGSAYYFHRNSAFDARNYFNPTPQPFSALLLHQFGASIGGPIKKKKWFYFVNYEGVRDKVGNPFEVFTPATSSLIGNPLTASSGIDPTEYSIPDAEAAAGCPAACNPLSLQLLSLFPKNPGFTFDPNDPSAINYDLNNTNREDNLVVKSDYHINDKNTISTRYIYANTNEIEEDTDALRPQWLTTAKPTTHVFGVDWTFTPNSAVTNDARFSYNRFYEKIAPVDSNTPASAYGLNTGINDPRLFGLPRINASRSEGFDYLGGNSSWPLWTNPSHTENYSDTVSWIHGKHTFRFGGVFSNGGVDYLRATEGRGRVDFDSLTDFLTGNVEDWSLQFGEPARNVSLQSYGFFAQDDFRITRHVTINLGVRYDITFPISEKNNLLANFDPTQGLVQLGHGLSKLYPTNYNNISPRLGVAWDVFGTGKTVVRSGAGMIFIQPSIRTFMFGGGGLNLNPSGLPKILPDGTTVPGTGNLNTFLVSGADPSLITWNQAGPIFPVTGTGANSCSTDVPCTVFAVDPNLHTPYVLNWNLNIQQQLSPSMLLQVAYVGNRGVKLYSTVDQNQPNPAIATDPATGCYSSFSDNTPCYQPARPFSTNCPVALGGLGTGGPCFPYLGFVNTLGNQSSSIYHGLQVTLTKRYSKGLYLLAGYTYAHAIDTAAETTNLADVPQNSLDFPAERASSDYDIRHRFTFSATYELPGVKAPLQMGKGWQLTALVTVQGGYPMEFFDADSDFTGTGEGFNNAGNDRWNILGSPKNIKWSQTNGIPFVGPGDAAYSSCLSAANTPALLESLVEEEGCYVQNGTVMYPNAIGTFGNMGRNLFRGPGFADWDSSVGKTWNLGERFKLQFRGEVFNVLNHPIFAIGSIRKDLNGSNLGLARATPDVWASNPVIGSGGSRHIQLGLKLLF